MHRAFFLERLKKNASALFIKRNFSSSNRKIQNNSSRFVLSEKK
jgi:hypothetical protein